MKHRTSELEGALLDAAVAKALNLPGELRDWDGKGMMVFQRSTGPLFRPHMDWSMGGLIVERERIGLTWDDIAERWNAELEHPATPVGVQRTFAIGPTPLIAAMRAFVASKLGEEVTLP